MIPSDNIRPAVSQVWLSIRICVRYLSGFSSYMAENAPSKFPWSVLPTGRSRLAHPIRAFLIEKWESSRALLLTCDHDTSSPRAQYELVCVRARCTHLIRLLDIRRFVSHDVLQNFLLISVLEAFSHRRWSFLRQQSVPSSVSCYDAVCWCDVPPTARPQLCAHTAPAGVTTIRRLDALLNAAITVITRTFALGLPLTGMQMTCVILDIFSRWSSS
jgi:hypothetical protein